MSVQKTSVIEAVHACLSADLTLPDYLTGGVWTGEIPEGQEMPYASLEVDSGDTEWCSRPPDLERTRFSIILFAVGGNVLDSLLDRLEDTLTNPDLTFTNNDYMVYMFPSRRTTKSEFARDKNGNQIFTGALMYEIGVFRY